MEVVGDCNPKLMQFDCLFCKESIWITCGPKGHVLFVVSQVVNTNKDKDPNILKLGNFQREKGDNVAELVDQNGPTEGVSHFGRCEDLGSEEHVDQIYACMASEDKEENSVTKRETPVCHIENVWSLGQKSQSNNSQQNIEMNRGHNRNGECSHDESILEEDNCDGNDPDFTNQISTDTVTTSTTECNGHNAQTSSGSEKQTMSIKDHLKYSYNVQSSKVLLNDTNEDLRRGFNKIRPCWIYLNDIVKDSLLQEKSSKQNEKEMYPQKCSRRKVVNASDISATKKGVDVHGSRFMCGVCNKTFSQPGNVRRHIDYMHKKEKKHKCDSCSKTFRFKIQLTDHIDWEHKGLKLHVCLMCGKAYKSARTLAKHKVRRKQDKSMPCLLCGQTCLNHCHWTQHLKQCPAKLKVRNDLNQKPGLGEAEAEKVQSALKPGAEQNSTTIKSIRCELCNQTISSKFQLQLHKKYRHGIPIVEEARTFCCEKCGKLYLRKGSLRWHNKYSCKGVQSKRIEKDPAQRLEKESVTANNEDEKRNEEKMCEMCHRIFSSVKYKYHACQTQQWKHVCEICKKPFCLRKELDFHKRKVHSIQNSKFYCDICNKGLSTRDHLKNHKRFVHLKERPFKCDICSKTFSSFYRRDAHKKAVHLKESPFVCQVCGKVYRYCNGLRRHRETHTGEKRFACQFCNKRFWQKSTRNTHYLVHTGTKNIKVS